MPKKLAWIKSYFVWPFISITVSNGGKKYYKPNG